MTSNPRIRFVIHLAVTSVVLAMEPLAVEARDSASIIVETDRPGVAVAPTMHGIFFEDINYAADGGLYAELVQNRSFEHRNKLYAWSKVGRDADGQLETPSTNPLNANNPNFLRLKVNSAGKGFGAANSGFDGIAVQQGKDYWFAVHARASAGYAGALVAVLEDESGKSIGECRVSGLKSAWQRFESRITSSATTAKARLVVLATAHGTVDLDVVSLMPTDTFKGRRNGLRADLAQLLADLKPGFMRFPGGCVVEGRELDNAYRWKDTIGEIWERKQNDNLWANQESPEYHQTCGLGFFEFFQFCEDIGAEPVPIVNCGMACQG